ncbi:hypothetical protein G3489_19345 [Shewanella baltica]|uniref:hypothetical protein n=1 Tax=Shewanella baltica TaxID=62322 RepID=UPI00217D55B3|nr:hypothetical protein [Shewanella baltica]MCS6271832.1 hypothetical protein [Shewanella baltica]
MNKDNKNDLLANEAIEIVKLKNELKARRKKRSYSRSKLRKYFAEAKRLKEEFGFSFEDISLWLRQFKKIKMTPDGVRSSYRRIEKEIDKDTEILS